MATSVPDDASLTSGGLITNDMDVCLWLTLKLNRPWSSVDVASLITPETLKQIINSFHRLEPSVKVCFLSYVARGIVGS